MQLCRILYHESLHFWLLFSSAYIASLVADEWNRLLHYEQTGVLSPPTDTVRDHALVLPDNPFSAGELVECWARYWDLHTRGVDRIVREEGITVPSGIELRGQHGYTGAAYDLVMVNGEDCAVYGRPYRWLLERWRSRLAALIFPVIAHAAFSTCRPVTTFCCFGSLLSSKFEKNAVTLQQKKIAQFESAATGVVNLDWLKCYGMIVDALVRPWLEVFHKPIVDWLMEYKFDASDGLLRPPSSSQMPMLADGLSIIRTSSLKSHPIFSEYASAFLTPGWVEGLVNTISSALAYDKRQEYKNALVTFARASPAIMLALPGQPPYRYLLGHVMPPPRIAFRNLTWYANRPVPLRLTSVFQFLSQTPPRTDSKADDFNNTYKEQSELIEQRVRRFRAAEKAISLGLPPNTFEVLG